jgi:hypothetical protein
MSIEANKSMYNALADFAGIEITANELAGCEALVNSLIGVIRGTPNEALAGIEPATIFRHQLTGIKESSDQKHLPERADQSPDLTDSDLNYISLSEAASLIKA